MTNYEKYKEIIDLTFERGESIALTKDTKEVVSCQGLKCENCLFLYRYGKHHYCNVTRIKWLVTEYTEPEIDWSKVPIDTPVLVSDDGTNWIKRYFAKYEDGRICAFVDAGTSWSSNGDFVDWDYAKLAEVE